MRISAFSFALLLAARCDDHQGLEDGAHPLLTSHATSVRRRRWLVASAIRLMLERRRFDVVDWGLLVMLAPVVIGGITVLLRRRRYP